MMAAFDAPSLDECRRHVAKMVHDPAAVPEELLLSRLTAYALPGAREAYADALRGMMDRERARPYRILDRLEQIVRDVLR